MSFETGVAIANCVIVPIAGWLLKNAFGRYTDRLDRAEARIAEHDTKIETKVSDEEWIRESMKLRDDVQKMGLTLARIEGKTDSTLLVASGVNRLADAIEKKVEHDGQG